ncbi:hypothetical protein [Breznakiella homolactica]|uniref:Quinolinate phosphoribosyl transferase C-terminal domain-containing protein n=1 Tax=Breznakiella homolactica TaxID=2798577 RepID=A0A7T8BD66_9SPIR|nr:hypothetical protein [Breznakiella homolactica]QQO10938.1 hypothetical protein JFL75_08480 [Breznakiella homolactica]
MIQDIRSHIFAQIQDREFTAVLRAEHPGCISGIAQLASQAEEIGVSFRCMKEEGSELRKDDTIGILKAHPTQIALAEERLIGTLAKFSGVATAARQAVALSEGKVRIVSGSWKKMPPAIKDGIRTAIASGGASFRISSRPMVYLDKNYIRMFGSIARTLEAVRNFGDYVKVVQIKGEQGSIEVETREAVENGAGILMVDTGRPLDLLRCTAAVNSLGCRKSVEIAFAGNVQMSEIPAYADYDLDILCIGKEIVDAPLLDMKLDVQYEPCEERLWA